MFVNWPSCLNSRLYAVGRIDLCAPVCLIWDRRGRRCQKQGREGKGVERRYHVQKVWGAANWVQVIRQRVPDRGHLKSTEETEDQRPCSRWDRKKASTSASKWESYVTDPTLNDGSGALPGEGGCPDCTQRPVLFRVEWHVVHLYIWRHYMWFWTCKDDVCLYIWVCGVSICMRMLYIMCLHMWGWWVFAYVSMCLVCLYEGVGYFCVWALCGMFACV